MDIFIAICPSNLRKEPKIEWLCNPVPIILIIV